MTHVRNDPPFAGVRAGVVRVRLACLALLASAACAPRSPGAPGGVAGPASRGTRESSIAAPPTVWAGRWEGVFRTPGQAPVPVAVALRLAPGGDLAGGLTAPGVGPEPIAFAAIEARGDSLTLRLPAAFRNLAYRGRRSADGRRYAGVVDGADAAGGPVPFALARAGTPEARALVAWSARSAALRAAAERLAAAARADSAAVRLPSDPNAARLVTGDVPRFWAAVDRAGPGAPPDDLFGAAADSLARLLQRDYLATGSPGLRAFLTGRITSAEDLAAAVRGQRARYDAVRAATLRAAEAEPAIRAALRRLQALYPAAVFPDVTVVVGRFDAGGTSGPRGPVLAAETQPDPARLPWVAVHELVHYQQRYAARTLLEQAFREGSADFLAELATGTAVAGDAKRRYGLAHERALWREFRTRLDDTAFAPWLYAAPADGRPADLGYVVGYRIAEAYYARAADKARAVREIVTARGGDVKALLAGSGYDP